MLNKRYFKLFVALTVVVIAMLAFYARTATSAVALIERGALPFDLRFPGKAQDDLAIANQPNPARLESVRAFPGKEQDDLVTVGTVVDKQFPGKEQDDAALAQSASGVNGSLIEDRADRALRTSVAPERYFPGKEQDDLVKP